jgi:hypothetical protein
VKIAMGIAETKRITFLKILVLDMYAIRAPKAKREIKDRIPLHGSSIVRVVLARWTMAPSRKIGKPNRLSKDVPRLATMSLRGNEKTEIAPVGSGNIKTRNPNGKEIFLVNSKPKR